MCKNNNKNKFFIGTKKNFIIFYKYLNISWKPILWVLPLSHRLPKQQHCSEIKKYKNLLVKERKINFKNVVNSIQYVNS